MSVSPAQVASLRAFNRFHTRLVGALDRRILDSPHSLTESRVLFEIAHGRDLTAATLAKALRLDPAYLSRVLARLAALGLIDKRPSASDGRASTLRLTRAGRAAFDGLDRAADAEAAATLEPLSRARRAQVAAAMATIMAELSAEPAAEPPIVIRGHAPGDVGWIVHRHGALYAAEYGWDETFEGLVAEIAGRFLKAHDPTRERCWVAEREGEILGSVFVVDAGDGVAKLRLLYVEPNARGERTRPPPGRRGAAVRRPRRVSQDDLVDQRYPRRGAAHLRGDRVPSRRFRTALPLSQRRWGDLG